MAELVRVGVHAIDPAEVDMIIDHGDQQLPSGTVARFTVHFRDGSHVAVPDVRYKAAADLRAFIASLPPKGEVTE